MNLIFKNLRDLGYLKTDEDIATKHYLTDNAIKVVEGFRKVEE